MDSKYLYSSVWTPIDHHVGVRTYRAFNACHILDFDTDVTHFDRNRETLTYHLDDKKCELTPELIVTYKGETFYLHCFKQGTVTKLMADALKQHYSIHFWGENITLREPLNQNIKLIRSRHLGRFSPDHEKSLIVPEKPITAQQLSKKRCCTIGEANGYLLDCAAYRLLTFDISKTYTADTVFTRPEKICI